MSYFRLDLEEKIPIEILQKLSEDVKLSLKIIDY